MFVVQDCPSLIMVLLLFQVKLRLDVTVEFIHASNSGQAEENTVFELLGIMCILAPG